MKLEIEQMATLSTSHLPQTEMEQLERLADTDLGAVMSDQYSVIVYTGLDKSDFGPTTVKLVSMLYEQGVVWAKFDCDGTIYDELETFDW